jgi:hypothetical protein
MKLGQEIDIQLVKNSGKSLEVGGVLVEINFFVNRVYRFGFKVGRTNADGSLKISYGDVEAIRRERAAESLMDYNTKLEDCDNSVQIVVPSDEKLREQMKTVIRIYQAPPFWAEDWPENNRVREVEKMVDLAEGATQVDIPAEPV